MSSVLQEPWAEGMCVYLHLEEVIARRTTRYQQALVARTETYGRALFLDDLLQSSECDEAIYHESFVHPAMMIHGAVQRVLVAGAGEGATLRELLRHGTVQEVLAIDLDAEVVALCREHLPEWSDGAFDDPRVTLRIEDIQDTLARPVSADAPWDLILLDVTDPVEDGPAVELFTTRFFARVAEHLHDDGLVVLQSGEIDLQDLRTTQLVHSTVRAVFPWVRTFPIYVPSFNCIWSLTLAAKRPQRAVPDDLEARVARLPAERLQAYSAEVHRALLTQPPWLQRALAVPGRVLTGEDEARLVTFRKPGTPTGPTPTGPEVAGSAATGPEAPGDPEP